MKGYEINMINKRIYEKKMTRRQNMIKILRKYIIDTTILLITLSTIGIVNAEENLIVNGDFESGYTGFLTDYAIKPLYIYETAYNITDDPKKASGFFASFGDHTNGHGLMMVVNGGRASNLRVWSQNVTVTPNTDYNFSTWVKSVYDYSPAQLQFIIDSDVIGTITASTTTESWKKFNAAWNSGSRTFITIKIIDLNINGMGNDFTIDDISFVSLNRPPIAEARGPYTVDEGSSIILDGSESRDPDIGDTITYSWDMDNDGLYDDASGETVSLDVQDGPDIITVGLQVTDNHGAKSTDTTTVNVNNVNPVIDSLSTDNYVVPVDTTIVGTGIFHDPGTLDKFAADWNWELGGSTKNLLEGSTTTTDSFSYPIPGVYSVSLTITDKDGGSDTENVQQYIVIYDPSAGFVTGGGWINSPEGAYLADPKLNGRANFGFVSKYQKGATKPTGETEFQFKIGDLNFHSTDYEWLVISGAKAQYKGNGNINGEGNYKFILTAIDGNAQINGGEKSDKFRIKIFDDAGTIYDNQLGADDKTDPTTVIQGGSIVVHSE